MKISRIDIRIDDSSHFHADMDQVIHEADANGESCWLLADGKPVAAIVPPEVLRFYAQFNELVPKHPIHDLDGPVECTRCQILRDNADWLYGTTMVTCPEATDPEALDAVRNVFNEMEPIKGDAGK